MSTMIFYREQAKLQQAEADNATLDNARNRCQSAADAWTKLADRLHQTDALRDARIRDAAIDAGGK